MGFSVPPLSWEMPIDGLSEKDLLYDLKTDTHTCVGSVWGQVSHVQYVVHVHESLSLCNLESVLKPPRIPAVDFLLSLLEKEIG